MAIKRKCIVTNEIFPIEQLIRFVLKKDGKIYLQTNEKIQGRGAYCKNKKEIIDILFLKKVLNRSFKFNIPNVVYDELRKDVDKYVKKQKKII